MKPAKNDKDKSKNSELQNSSSIHSEVSFKEEPSNKPKTFTEVAMLPLERYQFSKQVIAVMKKCCKYDRRQFFHIATNELKDGIDVQIRRLQQIKSKDKPNSNRQFDNEISLIVISNHIRGLVDLRGQSEEIFKKFGASTKNRKVQEDDQSKQIKENLLIKRYAEIDRFTEKRDKEIESFMKSNVQGKQSINYLLCKRFFITQIAKTKKLGQQRIVVSRIFLIQKLIEFLNILLQYSSLENPSPEQANISEQSQNSIINRQSNDISSDQQVNYEEYIINIEGVNEVHHETIILSQEENSDQKNKWSRYVSTDFIKKTIELSHICQQIPQLQTFNRTLQFIQIDNKDAFARIVDVLISLHHKVSYLSRNKPQLLKEIEVMVEEISFINETVNVFLAQIDEELPQIFGMDFGGFDQRKKSQLTSYFGQLKQNLRKLTQIIISQDLYHTQNFQKMQKIKSTVSLFLHLMDDYPQCQQEWANAVSNLTHPASTLSPEQSFILDHLNQCLQIHLNKLSLLQQQMAQTTARDKTNEELEEEVNKLIEDYERVKIQNQNLLEQLDMLEREREEWRMEIEERDNMIGNLSHVKVNLEKKLYDNRSESEYRKKSIKSEIDEKRKYQMDSQKHFQAFLLAKEQLKASESQKQRLKKQLEEQQQKNIKNSELYQANKAQNHELQKEINELKDLIEQLKNEQNKSSNKMNKRLSEIQGEKELLEKSLKQEEKSKLKLTEKLQQSETKFNDYIKEVQQNYATFDRKYEDFQIQIKKLQKQNEKLRKQIESLKLTHTESSAENQALLKQLSEFKGKIKAYRAKGDEDDDKDHIILQLKSKIDKLNNKILVINNQLDESHQLEEEESKKNRINTKKIKELQEQLRELEKEKDKIKKEKADFVNEYDQMYTLFDNYKINHQAEVKQFKETIAAKDKHAADIQQERNKLIEKLFNLEADLMNKVDLMQALNDQNGRLKSQLTDSSKETQKILEERLHEQTVHLEQKIVQKEQNQGRLKKEIDRLEAQINRLAEDLRKIIKDLAQKQHIIKIQKERNEQNMRTIHHYNELKIIQKSTQDQRNNENFQKLDEKFRQFQRWKRQLQNERDQYKRQLHEMGKKVIELQDALKLTKQQNSAKISKLVSENMIHLHTAEELQKKYLNLQKQKSDRQAELLNLIRHTAEQGQGSKKHREQELQNQISNLQREKQSMIAERNSLIERIGALSVKLDDIMSHYHQRQTAFAQKERELLAFKDNTHANIKAEFQQLLKSRIDQLNKEFGEQTNRQNTLTKNQLDNLSAEKQKLLREIEGLKRQNNRLNSVRQEESDGKQKRLQHAEDELRRLVGIINNLQQKYKQSLEKIKLAQQKGMTDCSLLNQTIDQLKRDLQSASNEKETLKRQNQVLNQQRDQFKKESQFLLKERDQLSQLNDKLAKQKQQTELRGNKMVSGTQKERNQLLQEKLRLENLLKQSQNTRLALGKDVEGSNNKCILLQTELDNMFNHYEKQMAIFLQENNNFKAIIAELEQKLRVKESQYERINNEKNSYMKLLSDQKENNRKNLQKLQTEYKNILISIEKQQKQKAQLILKVNDLNRLVVVKNEQKKVQDQLMVARQHISKMNDDLNRLVLQRDHLRAEINTISVLLEQQRRGREDDRRSLQQKLIIIENQGKQLNQLSLNSHEITQLRGQCQKLRQQLDKEIKRGSTIESQLISRQQLFTAKIKEREDELQKLISALKRQLEECKGGSVSNAYLLEKIRALEELVQVLTEEIKEERHYSKQMELKVKQIETNTKQPTSQGKSIVQNNTNQKKISLLEKALSDLQRKQQGHLEQIEWLKKQNISLKQQSQQRDKERGVSSMSSLSNPKTTTLPLENIPISSTYDDKYYLREEGEHLRQALQSMRQANTMLNAKVDQILQNSRRSGGYTSMFETLVHYNVPLQTSQQLDELVRSTKILIESIRSLRDQNTRLVSLLSEAPSFQNLNEFVYRILVYFSEIDMNSPQAHEIQHQLANISKTYTGGLYFTVLEEFTIHILQNNAIEEYKRELREKAQQLLLFKERLDELITRQLRQEEQIVNKTNAKGELYGQRAKNSGTYYAGRLTNRRESTPRGSMVESGQNTPTMKEL